MAAGNSEITYLSYVKSIDMAGNNNCSAIFDFQGNDYGDVLYEGYTFGVNGYEDFNPELTLKLGSSNVWTTAKVIESYHETATLVSGKLQINARYGNHYELKAYDSTSQTVITSVEFDTVKNQFIKAKNLISGVLAENITTSTTNILVHVGDNLSAQSLFDFFPNTPFYITIMPKTPAVGVANNLDSEIIKITGVSNDQVGNAALTGVRAQRGTTAKAFAAGDVVTVGSYCDDAVFLNQEGTETEQTPWISAADLVWSTIVDKIYPIGSIFMSATLTTAADVGAALGGTWTAWGSGRVPVGVDTSDTAFDTVEETGGNKTHTHQVKIGQRTYFGVPMEESQYGLYIEDESGNRSNVSANKVLNSGNFQRNAGVQSGMTAFNHDGFAVWTQGNSFGSSTLQPYITCYMYKRIA